MIANLLNYIVWDPDPILAHLGPMTIRYYSTCWMIGLLLGLSLIHICLQTDMLIMDEVQRLKNWNTQISRAARKIESDYSVILSGTRCV